MCSDGNKFIKNQIILISTGPQKMTPAGGNQPKPSNNNQISKDGKPLNRKGPDSSSEICHNCLKTQCEKYLKNTELSGDSNDLPEEAYQKYCSRCCIFFGDHQSMPDLNNLEPNRDTRRVELKNRATQDSRHSLLCKTSETKEVQTSKTDLGKLDLLKLVLQLSECPCKQICKTVDALDTVKQHIFNEKPDVVVRADKNNEEPKIINKTSNLVATTVCQMSLGSSVDHFYENESKCTVVDARRKSEHGNDQNPFDILLKPKSTSVPQMKIEELKNRLKKKNKPKDTIGEINRMFANVRKNEACDIFQQNRPSTRIGPRILPVVKSPNYVEEKQHEINDEQKKIANETKIQAISRDLNANKDKLARICDTTKSSNAQQQPGYVSKPLDLKPGHDVKKCIYTLSCDNEHLDKDPYTNVRGDYEASRKEKAVCHCTCRKNSFYKNVLQDDSDLSNLSSSTFS